MPSRSGRLRSSAYAVSAPSRNDRHLRSAASSPGSGSRGRSGAASAAVTAAVASASLRACRSGQLARCRRRVGPAVRAPGPREGGEDLVRVTRAVDDETRAHGIRRPRLDPLDARPAQALGDGLVAAVAGRCRLAGHVHRGGADPRRELGHHPPRVAVHAGSGHRRRPRRWPAASPRARPGGPRRRPPTAAGSTTNATTRSPSPGRLAGRQQRGVVAAAQVAAQPEQGGHRAVLTTAGRGPGAAGRASRATR